jgi:allophanate hydrolase subunit 2
MLWRKYGPDLENIAAHAQLTPEEVVALHTSRDYLIYMLGFLPGFCYLGGLDERIHTPRLSTPRLRIPAGSVGIGGSQTGIYPMDSPGGWQLMGMTPVKTYDPAREVPILLQAGEYIRFVRIDEDEFRRISQEVEAGTYQVAVREGRCEHGLSRYQGGMLTTVQDFGRSGYQSQGFSVGGAMDVPPQVANLLLDNTGERGRAGDHPHRPVLEFTADTIIAITGGISLQAQRRERRHVHRGVYPQGDVLSLAAPAPAPLLRGLFGYLDIPVVMGSRCTSLKSGIGGFMGRRWRQETMWASGSSADIALLPVKEAPPADYDKRQRRDAGGDGPQDNLFSKQGVETFLHSEYTVTGDFDRMGCRLEGPIIAPKNTSDIISDGIALGAVQVPSAGSHHLLSDRQTTAAYAKIATCDLGGHPRLVQKKTDQKIRFQAVSVREAQELYLREIKELERMRKEIHTPCKEVLDCRQVAKRLERLYRPDSETERYF